MLDWIKNKFSSGKQEEKTVPPFFPQLEKSPHAKGSTLFEEMSFDELAEEQKQEWMLLKTDIATTSNGYWLCRNQLPTRPFPSVDEAEQLCGQYGIKITKVNASQVSLKETLEAAREIEAHRPTAYLFQMPSKQCECEECNCMMHSEWVYNIELRGYPCKRGLCQTCKESGHMKSWSAKTA